MKRNDRRQQWLNQWKKVGEDCDPQIEISCFPDLRYNATLMYGRCSIYDHFLFVLIRYRINCGTHYGIIPYNNIRETLLYITLSPTENKSQLCHCSNRIRKLIRPTSGSIGLSGFCTELFPIVILNI